MSRVLARVLIISAFTALHFVVSVGALIASLAMGMARFETGPGGLESYEPPTTTEHVLDTMVDVLLSPLLPLSRLLPPVWLPAPLEWMALVLNSALWGVLAYLAVRLLVGLFRGTSGTRF